MRRLLLATMLLAATRAHAAPNDVIARPLTLDAGQLAVELWADINLAPGGLGRSTSISPDVWYGVLPRLTVGLVHSYPSADRFGPGATFCVEHGSQLDVDCQDTYRGSGLDVRWSAVSGSALLGGDFAVAPRARFLVRDIDPVKPALTFGALLRWTRGRYAITSDPYLELGLANTDQGNRHALFVPLALSIQPVAHWELALRTGVNTDLYRYTDIEGERRFGTDAWHVPLAVENRVRIDDHWDIGVMLAFTTLVGPQNTAKNRVLFFVVGWRS